MPHPGPQPESRNPRLNGGAPHDEAPLGESSTIDPLEPPEAGNGSAPEPPEPSFAFPARSGGAPATQRQLKYIKALGGDPATATSKRDAHLRINRLLNEKRSWPLDRQRLEKRGAEAGATSQGSWESAHQSLLAGLRLDLQEYVDLTLDSLRSRLSDGIGPDYSVQSLRPESLIKEAEAELKALELHRTTGQPLVEPSPSPATPSVEYEPAPPDPSPDAGSPSVAPDPSPDEDSPSVAPDPSPDKDSPSVAPDPSPEEPDPNRHVWFLSITLLVACITAEAVVNIQLLRGALQTGIMGAFVLAAMLSAINVGGFGMFAGFWLARLWQTLGAALPHLFAMLAVWSVPVIGFNLLLGRHREDMAREIPTTSAGTEVSTPASGATPPIASYNPLDWELDALAFAILGTFLCALAFAKGFGLARALQPDDQTTPAPTPEPAVVSSPPAHVDPTPPRSAAPILRSDTPPTPSPPAPGDREMFTRYKTLYSRYHTHLTSEIEDTVADHYRALDQERRNAAKLLAILGSPESRAAYIGTVEHAFIVEHNNNSADKIDAEHVAAHRRTVSPNALDVTAVEPEILDEAGALISDWRRTGQRQFAERVQAASATIEKRWKDYESLVLRERAQGDAR